MKSMRTYSRDSQTKTLKIPYSTTKKDTSFIGKPTPLDFDSFIPWFCLELQVSRNIIVRRTNQAKYVPYAAKLSKGNAKSSKSKSKSLKIKLHNEDKSISAPKISFATSTIEVTDAIPVTTCYDKRGRLVEIEIVGCPFEVPRKVIQAFNLCLPFHISLYKLSIRKGGLSQVILYEISKLLHHSNITDVCLDDSRVPGGNYSILLDRPSQIKYLSLKRCNIDDDECKRIAAKLHLSGSTTPKLLLLDLTSNQITDEGAKALGEMLKTNRSLLHLNLSGNKISDAGASFIFQYLQEFSLSYDDIKEKRRRRIDYLKCKSIIYEKCLKELKLARIERELKKDVNVNNDQDVEFINIPQNNQRKKSKNQAVSSVIVEGTTVEDDAEKKAIEILGDYEDPFAEKYIKRNGDVIYAIGNLTLTSLNLAYNNLTLLSVRKILKIVKYQSEVNKFNFSTGLLRLVLHGNNIPDVCDELYEIDIYLKRACLENERSSSLFGNLLRFKLD